jgi:3-methyladenine DNA glycosylase AlkD
MSLAALRRELRRRASRRKAAILRRFFKTGPGEYGEGDRFLGVVVPDIRAVAKRHRDLPLPAFKPLLRSPWHEERLLGLLMLVDRHQRGDAGERARAHRVYLAHIPFINNWDLVDLTAPHLVGAHLAERSTAPLRAWARSRNLWRRRIAVLATFHFIRQGRHGETLRLAQMLLDDPEDLMHKAVGWMLREVGKRDGRALEAFLRRHARRMPRTMLRYAIERFPERKRRRYLVGSRA